MHRITKEEAGYRSLILNVVGPLCPNRLPGRGLANLGKKSKGMSLRWAQSCLKKAP